MERLQFEEWVLKVDISKTKEVYSTIHFNNEVLEWLNYIQVISLSEPELFDFFNRFGMDMLKPSQLSYHRVDENTMMMYSGSYHVCGELLVGEIDGWDVVIGNHCFSITEDFEAIPNQMQGSVVEISFEAVLPWILDIPIHAK
ncbi:hypothetical protein [Lysinibacillus sp. 54212]|uniref:hypothetical protein n=1 Tax=Lysinibacillus sp. 54212 TaxID=3119829 RepID=UPI002FCC03B5